MSDKCPRCQGRGDVYQVGSAYSMVDTGGKKVKCPLCVGSGKYNFPDVSKGRTKSGASGKTKAYKNAKKAKPEGVCT